MTIADQFTPRDGVVLVPGFAAAWPNVKIGGVSQAAAWPDSVYAAPGDPVIVAQLVRPDAPAQNVVVSRVGQAGPREGTVSSVPGGSDTVTVTANGTDYLATFPYGYALSVGDRVRLLWQGRDATVLFKVGVTPAAAATTSTTAPPPPPKSSGTFNAQASDSGTYTPELGGWDRWANGGGHVYEGGSAYGGSNSGAWFYAGAMAELAGATISRVQFRLPERRTVGSYNSAVTVNFWAHTSPNKPGGDVSRTVGPTPYTVQPGWAGGFIDLPTSFASTLINGGGISISGEPYAGFLGKPSDPSSGQLRLDWSR